MKDVVLPIEINVSPELAEDIRVWCEIEELERKIFRKVINTRAIELDRMIMQGINDK